MTFDPSAQKALAKEFKVQQSALSGQAKVWIDTKGLFNPNARSFAVDRKWVWSKFKVFVCEVVPKKFFAKFGCPKASFCSKKTKKARKIFAGFRSLRQAFGL